jgi:transcriptional regulator with XRE-family HTH domain
MNFREKIKELCRKRGITQKELASILGITDISLNQTLRGQYPQLQTLEKIANALEVPISELFERQPSDTINCPHCGGVIKVEKG